MTGSKTNKPNEIVLYNKFIDLFNNLYPGRDIREKAYDITLFRGLVIYFLYTYKSVTNDKCINYRTLAKAFNYKNQSSALRARITVANLIEVYSEKQTTNNFTKLFYKMAKIYAEYVK